MYAVFVRKRRSQNSGIFTPPFPASMHVSIFGHFSLPSWTSIHTVTLQHSAPVIRCRIYSQYDTRCYFNVRSKAAIGGLIYRTEMTTK